MRRAGPMARPFAPSSSPSPAMPPMHSQPLLFPTEFLRGTPPDFPPLPLFLFLPRSFQDFPFLGQPIGATFRFALIDAFSQPLLFIPLFLFLPFHHISGILIDESPPRKVGKLYCYLSHGIPSFSPLIHPPSHDPTNIFFLLIPLLFLLHRDLDDFRIRPP